jgi:hypothetical protein
MCGASIAAAWMRVCAVMSLLLFEAPVGVARRRLCEPQGRRGQQKDGAES